MEKPSGRNRRQMWRTQRPPLHSFIDRLAPVDVQQSTTDTRIVDHQSAQTVGTYNAKQDFHAGDRRKSVLPPVSSSYSVDCVPETAALYFKFPTFIKKGQLYDHITKHGFRNNVVAIDMHNRKCTKVPAGSAKVSIAPPTLMEEFIKALHGTCLSGEFQQLLSVQPYVQKEDKCHKVFVGSGLPHTVTEKDIHMHFVKLKDEITDIEIKRERRRNTCFIFIVFRSSNAAKQAVDVYNNTTLLEKQIKVEMYQPECMIRTRCLTPKESPKIHTSVSTIGPKIRQELKTANSKFELHIDVPMAKSNTHHSSAMATNLRMECDDHSAISRQKSTSRHTKRREVLKTSTTVIAENLDPEFPKAEIEHLTNVRIDKYTPSNLTPDKVAAWIEVSNCTDARIVADYFNKRVISGKEIHCFMARSSALHKLMSTSRDMPCDCHVNCHQLSVAADRSSYPQVIKSEKEMACNQPKVPSSVPQTLMLPTTDDIVRTISLQRGLWKYLTTIEQDDTMLLQQFIAPFAINPNVEILLQWQACSIKISGISNAVIIAHRHISNELDKYIYVEDRIKMSALVYLNPSLQEILSKEHGVTISGFYVTSFVIKFDGIPSAVRAARKIIDDLLSNAMITNVQFAFSQSLLLVAQKQLEAEHCKAYSIISESDSNSELQMSGIVTDRLTVTVCSFNERHYSMAITLLDTKDLIIEEVLIPPLTISNDEFNQQVKQLEDNFCVLIQQRLQHINVHDRQNFIKITGFCPSRVKNAQSSVISLLKLYSEQQVKLECKPEEVIYLYKVDKESRCILTSLPARVSTNGDEIRIIGDHNCISQSKNLLFGGPLLHLQFKSYTFKCNSMFISPIKHYILKPFAAENTIQYYIDKSENNKHTDGDVSIESDPEIDGFRIIIYSKDEHVFTKVCCEMEVITPNTQLFQPYCEEAIHFIRKTKKSFEDKYRVCVIIDDSTYEVTVYGLTLDEVQQCWKHIDNDVESNVETTKQIPLNRYECMYLEEKQGDKLKQSFSCELTFPQHREKSVYIRGKIRDVKSVESRLADLRSKLQVIKFTVQCKSLLIKMWKKWWHDLIIQQQEKHGVIIQFDDDLKSTAEHGRSTVQVAFEIIGTNVAVLRCIENTIHDEQTEEREISLKD